MRGRRNALSVGTVAIGSALALLTWGGVAAAPVSATSGVTTFTVNGTYTVPDGVDCVGVSVSGGMGGDGADDTAAGGAGGNGATVVMTLVVEPGTEIGVVVGPAGASGSSGGGGGGGSASALFLPGGEPFVVAAGGGGGGAAQGANAGGAGGAGADDGVDGSAGAAGSATPGGGGANAPGIAGTNDGTGSAPTAGDASPPGGGTGGGGTYGGGGGGEGYFGGGGGGGADAAPGAGGGGGGSAYNPAVSDSIVDLEIVSGANPGPGEVSFYELGDEECFLAPLTVTKTVSGPVAPGTTFTVHLECTAPMVVPLDGSPSAMNARDLVFTADASGIAQPASGYTVGFEDPGACTVTETVAGGAVETSYACASRIDPIVSSTWATAADDPTICSAAGPTDAPITVGIVTESQHVTVAVTNTFLAFTG